MDHHLALGLWFVDSIVLHQESGLNRVTSAKAFICLLALYWREADLHWQKLHYYECEEVWVGLYSRASQCYRDRASHRVTTCSNNKVCFAGMRCKIFTSMRLCPKWWHFRKHTCRSTNNSNRHIVSINLIRHGPWYTLDRWRWLYASLSCINGVSTVVSTLFSFTIVVLVLIFG